MRERPILFSGPMVRALLAGEKTQTRRVVKGFGLDHPDAEAHMIRGEAHFGIRGPGTFHFTHGEEGDLPAIRCPYGKPGDRLWVRETVACGACAPGKPSHWSPSFWRREQGSPGNPNGLWYAADSLAPARTITERGKWTPAIHMPRWASRITLEITDIRVERLHAITEEDALAEGVREPSLGDLDVISPDFIGKLPRAAAPPLVLWEFLWRKINGDASWEANPFVWRVSFRRIDAPSPAMSALNQARDAGMREVAGA